MADVAIAVADFSFRYYAEQVREGKAQLPKP
jgi:hypothetical protein